MEIDDEFDTVDYKDTVEDELDPDFHAIEVGIWMKKNKTGWTIQTDKPLKKNCTKCRKPVDPKCFFYCSFFKSVFCNTCMRKITHNVVDKEHIDYRVTKLGKLE